MPTYTGRASLYGNECFAPRTDEQIAAVDRARMHGAKPAPAQSVMGAVLPRTPRKPMRQRSEEVEAAIQDGRR